MKISIITVCFNSAKTLQDSISSVVFQNYPSVDYIVVDAASKDGTSDILKKNSKYISQLVSEPDKGIYHAMNKGIALANGDIIGILNSDDFYANNQVLNSVAKAFREDSLLDACYSDLEYIDQVNSSKIIRYWKSSQFFLGAFSKGWCPPHTTFFVRRSVYERYGVFNLKYNIAADVELMMRFLEVHKIKTKYIPKTWVKMRMGGTTNKNFKNIWTQNQEILKALKRHGLSFNYLSFFTHKLISRIKQFLLKAGQ